MKLSFTATCRQFKSLFLCLGLFTFGFSTQAQNCFVNSRIHKITANISPAIQSYMEFKPLGYDANPNKRYPLLVYIGGTGEMFQQPGGTDQDLCPAIQYSLPWRINVGHFPDVVRDGAGNEYSYLVVMPYVTKWEQQYSVDPGAVIDYMLAHYRIDTSRIYLTAMSRGTDNIMGYITSSPAAAKRIAAIVPVANCFPANVGTSTYSTQVSNLASGDVHMWGISCPGDVPCTEKYIKNWVSSLDSLKRGNSLFTYATYACDDTGANASHHYAWNSAYDPDYRLAPGNKNVYEWMIQFSKGGTTGGGTPTPPPAQPDCNKIAITGLTSSIKIKGLVAPVITVQVFNSSWASVYNQYFNNSPDSINISSLPTGTYHVTVNFYNSSWASICSKTQDATVGATTPPPPPPPPPTGTGDCSAVTATGTSNSIKVGGLTAPVVSVQVFNNSWATVFNQSYTNSPGTVTVPSLPTGVYHLKVSLNNANWSLICDKMLDATVGTRTEAATSVVATEVVDNRIAESNARVVTVMPNPFSNAVQVNINSTRTETANISVIDISGREIARKSVSLQLGSNRFSIDDLNRYNPGNYILRLVTKDGVQNIRLIKQ